MALALIPHGQLVQSLLHADQAALQDVMSEACWVTCACAADSDVCAPRSCELSWLSAVVSLPTCVLRTLRSRLRSRSCSETVRVRCCVTPSDVWVRLYWVPRAVHLIRQQKSQCRHEERTRSEAEHPPGPA